jgi:hypothetical protein
VGSLLWAYDAGGALEVALEGVEAAGHLGPVGLEPIVESTKRFDTEAVEATLGVDTDLDEARISQHLQVARHTGLVHADHVDQFCHRTLAIPDRVEDPTARRFGDHIEDS